MRFYNLEVYTTLSFGNGLMGRGRGDGECEREVVELWMMERWDLDGRKREGCFENVECG